MVCAVAVTPTKNSILVRGGLCQAKEGFGEEAYP
jgi:hypothetical protein